MIKKDRLSYKKETDEAQINTYFKEQALAYMQFNRQKTQNTILISTLERSSREMTYIQKSDSAAVVEIEYKV